MEINPKMKIEEVLKLRPNAPAIMMEYGFPCVGCPLAQLETLEDGAKKHGISGEKFSQFLEEINNC